MRLFLGLLLTLAAAPAARADLIISVGSADVQSGQTGSVDVFVRSTTGTDSLQIANVQFQITPVSPPPLSPALSFTNPQSDSQLTNPGYIFAGNSAAAPFGPASFITTTITPNDTYFGGDGTADASGVLVPTTNRLLVRLDLTAGAGAGGSVYQISLVNSGTLFLDPNFTPIPFSSTAGLVTTPEPTTLAVFGGFAAVGLVRARRRIAAVS